MLFDYLVKRLAAAGGEKNPPAVFGRRCLRRRFHACQCRICAEACPVEAITITEETIDLNQDRCHGCMLCAGVCTADVFDDGWDPVVALEKTQRMCGDVVFSCRRRPVSANTVCIPCLGSLSCELLAALLTVATDAGRRILFDVSRCKSCDNSFVAGIVEGKIAAVAVKAGIAGSEGLRLVSSVEEWASAATKKVADPSRRSFLRGVQALLPAGDTLPGLTEKKSGETETAASVKRPCRSRECMRLALECAPETAKLLSPFFFRLSVAESCDFCRACVGMCPSGALSICASESERKKLIFISARCSGCGLCVGFCRQQALKLEEGVEIASLAETVVLEENV